MSGRFFWSSSVDKNGKFHGEVHFYQTPDKNEETYCSFCPHDHDTGTEASRCAQKKTEEMRNIDDWQDL